MQAEHCIFSANAKWRYQIMPTVGAGRRCTFGNAYRCAGRAGSQSINKEEALWQANTEKAMT